MTLLSRATFIEILWLLDVFMLNQRCSWELYRSLSSFWAWTRLDAAKILLIKRLFDDSGLLLHPWRHSMSLCIRNRVLKVGRQVERELLAIVSVDAIPACGAN